MTGIKLEYGKRYRLRNGRETGPLIATPSDKFPFRCRELLFSWSANGIYGASGALTEFDIIAPLGGAAAQEAAPAPVDVAALELAPVEEPAPPRFKVGDRVEVAPGVGIVGGKIGTVAVVGEDDYGVEFGLPFKGHDLGGKLPARNGWWLLPDQLRLADPVPASDPAPVPDAPMLQDGAQPFVYGDPAPSLRPNAASKDELTLRDQIALSAPVDLGTALNLTSDDASYIPLTMGCILREGPRKTVFETWARLRFEFADAFLAARKAGSDQ